MKKIILFLLTAALTIAALSSCSNGNGDGATGNTTAGHGNTTLPVSSGAAALTSKNDPAATDKPIAPSSKEAINLIPDHFGKVERDYTGNEMEFTYDSQFSENVDMLFDGNMETKYRYIAPKVTGKPIVWSMTDSVTVTRYAISTASDSEEWKGRNPIGWSLYGTNELTSGNPSDGSWTLLTRVEKANIPDENYKTFDYELDKPGTYRYFMLIFDELNEYTPGLVFSGEYDEFGEPIMVEGQEEMLVQLSEFNLYGWVD